MTAVRITAMIQANRFWDCPTTRSYAINKSLAYWFVLIRYHPFCILNILS